MNNAQQWCKVLLGLATLGVATTAAGETVYKSYGPDGSVSYGMLPERGAALVETLQFGPYATPRAVAPVDPGACAGDAQQTLFEIQQLLAQQDRAGIGPPLTPLPPLPAYGYSYRLRRALRDSARPVARRQRGAPTR